MLHKMKVSHMHFSKTNLTEIINEESLYSWKEINIFIEAFQITGQAIHRDCVICIYASGGGGGASSSHFFIHVCQHLFHIGLKHSMTKLSPFQF